MPATVEYYAEVVAAFRDIESLTVLTVAGAAREQVAAQLGVDLSAPVDDDIWAEGGQVTAWTLLAVPGGVLAVELSGFGDPSTADLAALSGLSVAGGAAVTRSNILAHYRFGCARDGDLLFDDDEFIFTDSPDAVPTELRPLFDLVYDDLRDDTDDEDDESAPEPFAVGSRWRKSSPASRSPRPTSPARTPPASSLPRHSAICTTPSAVTPRRTTTTPKMSASTSSTTAGPLGTVVTSPSVPACTPSRQTPTPLASRPPNGRTTPCASPRARLCGSANSARIETSLSGR